MIIMVAILIFWQMLSFVSMKNVLYLHYLVLRKKSNEFVGSDKTPNKVIDLVGSFLN